MDRAENRLQPKPVTHRERELREHVACSRADDRCAENAILARRGQNFDETAVVAVEDRAVEVGKIIARDLVSDSVFVRFLLIEADAGDLDRCRRPWETLAASPSRDEKARAAH